MVEDVKRFAEVEEDCIDCLFIVQRSTPVVNDSRCDVARASAREEAVLVVGQPDVPCPVEHLS